MLHHFLRTLAPKTTPITPAFVKSVTSSAATIATGTVAVGDLLVLIDYAISSSTTIPTTVVPSGYTVLDNYGAVTGSGASTRTIVSYRFSTVTTTTTLTGMEDFAERKTLLVFNGGGSSVSAVNFSNTSNTGNPDAITSLSSGTQNTITAVAQSTAVQNTSSTTINVNVPTGTSDGDLMIMYVTSGSVSTNWTTPSGWTLAVSAASRFVFYRTASSEPASYTVTQASSQTSSAAILTYRNAAIDAIGAFGTGANPSVAPAITTTDTNTVIIDYAASTLAGSITYSTPTGYTALVSDSDATAPSYAIFTTSQASAGSTGTVSTTASSSNPLSVLISIKPTYALTSPVIAIGNYQTNSSGTVTTPTFLPLQDGTITNTTAQTIRYKIFQSTGASVTIDSADGGTYNVNGVGGLQIT